MSSLKRSARSLDDAGRRQFLKQMALGCFGLAGGSPLLRAMEGPESIPLRGATARNVIFLYMDGGMSQLDTFDPKPGKETQGPTQALSTTVDGMQLSQHFPNLVRHAEQIALIRSMSSTQGAHSQGRYFLHTSYQLRGTIRHPSLGAWLLRMEGLENPTLPGHVSIGTRTNSASAGFLAPAYAPLPIGDPEAGLQHGARNAAVAPEQFQRRLDRLAEMNRSFESTYDQTSVRAYREMYDQAVALMSSRDLAAFDLSLEPESIRAAYGNSKLGQGCLLARRLVEHGVRYVEVAHGGWDTHNDNFDSMEELCPPLDQGLSALLADLDRRGLLEETLVVVASEFGRTPDVVTQRMGRNHYPKAFTALLAGGGVRGGTVWGRTDEFGREIIENPVTVPDFNATIAYALGLPLDHEMFSPSGRPFTVADKGRPVEEIFA